MSKKDFRLYVTKSKAGHYWLTLIHTATRIKVCGQYGHSSKVGAMNSEYPTLVEKLAARVAEMK